MKNEIDKLIETIKLDYARWMGNISDHDRNTSIVDEMIEKFNNSIKVNYGSKYVKIIKDNSVWGFIVNTDDDPKFRKGDILKPAGFNAPARNSARGNILDGNYKVYWTGPFYLK
jgi:hypothetical protein